MADTGIFVSGGGVIFKAGINISGGGAINSFPEGAMNNFISQAESFINVVTMKNWTDIWDSLNTDVRGILTEAAGNLAAIYVITYNMQNISETTSRIEAEDRLNVLKVRYTECISVLRDKERQRFMTNESGLVL